jgi:membrane fusion protein (multidrug efflux system)
LLPASCCAAALALLAAFGGCGKASPGVPASARGATGSAESPRGGLPIPVAVQAARIGSIASYYTATATLEVEKEAEVLARVAGIVKSIACEEGDLVEEGATLLEIDNDEYRLRLRLAESNAQTLQLRHDRVQEMWSQDLISVEEYEAARNALAAARAEEGLARLNLSYTHVAAPFAGRVIRRLADVGQNVSPGTPLFRLADFDPLLARVHVPAKEFRKLMVDQPVEMVLDSNKQRLYGRIKLVSPVIDPATGTIKVTVEVPHYPRETRPGDFAEVRIITERRAASTLVARTAVLADKGEQVVYVAAGDIAERRVVEVGFTDETHAEILRGVAPGELVVVKGQRSLKHAAPLKVLEGGTPLEAPAAQGLGS